MASGVVVMAALPPPGCLGFKSVARKAWAEPSQQLSLSTASRQLWPCRQDPPSCIRWLWLLLIMAKIDVLYLEDPCSNSRRMVNYLARDGIQISRDRVRNLMRRIGLRAI